MRDAHGFDGFYRDTSLRMMRYGYALTGDLAEAQDVVQDTVITVAKNGWTCGASGGNVLVNRRSIHGPPYSSGGRLMQRTARIANPHKEALIMG